ncbi:hypothetical protein B0H19DRAFT_1055703 [Mycena capillaripes]|nr:hypothetical protein B0H19DRAFT_1055703 [Mycena capillaripes]
MLWGRRLIDGAAPCPRKLKVISNGLPDGGLHVGAALTKENAGGPPTASLGKQRRGEGGSPKGQSYGGMLPEATCGPGWTSTKATCRRSCTPTKTVGGGSCTSTKATYGHNESLTTLALTHRQRRSATSWCTTKIDTRRAALKAVAGRGHREGDERMRRYANEGDVRWSCVPTKMGCGGVTGRQRRRAVAVTFQQRRRGGDVRMGRYADKGDVRWELRADKDDVRLRRRPNKDNAGTVARPRSHQDDVRMGRYTDEGDVRAWNQTVKGGVREGQMGVKRRVGWALGGRVDDRCATPGAGGTNASTLGNLTLSCHKGGIAQSGFHGSIKPSLGMHATASAAESMLAVRPIVTRHTKSSFLAINSAQFTALKGGTSDGETEAKASQAEARRVWEERQQAEAVTRAEAAAIREREEEAERHATSKHRVGAVLQSITANVGTEGATIFFLF